MNAAPRKMDRLFVAILGALVLAAVAYVQRRSLHAFFAADDLVHLQQAVGLLPTPHHPWRVLTQVVYFRAMVRLVGAPEPFMLVNLTIHLLNVLLLHRVLRNRGASLQSATLAAVLFGGSPLWVTVLHRAVTINDLLALTFALVSLLALEKPGAGRAIVSSIAFLLGLFCKESILFLPCVTLLPGRSRGSLGARVGRIAPHLVLLVVVAAALLFLSSRGIGPSGAAYATGPGAHLFHNLMTYTTWAVDLVHPLPDLVSSPDTSAWHGGLCVAVILAVASRLWRVHAEQIFFGASWFVLGLLPVLPLIHSTYGHYLYVAMPGFCLAVATVIECLVTAGLGWMRGGRRLSAAVLAAIGLLYVAHTDRLIERRIELRVPGSDLPMDPLLRGALVAGQAIGSIGAGLAAGDRKVAVFAPAGMSRVIGARSGRTYSSTEAPRAYDVVEAVLGGGQAARLFYPQLDSIVFVSSAPGPYRDRAVFLEVRNGILEGFGTGGGAHVRAARFLLEMGRTLAARERLKFALREFPGDSSAAEARQLLDTLDAREQPPADESRHHP